jgi:flagellar hook-basal body complex protein FliE
MAISPISGVGGGMSVTQLAQLYRQQVTASSAAGQTTAADTATRAAASGQVDAGTASRGADFASAVGQGLQQLDGLDRTASAKAIGAATGDLTDIHDYVIAATQAQTATELTTTVRNKALDAFNEIMRMPL